MFSPLFLLYILVLFLYKLLGRIPSSPSVFTADEYRAWLSRAPSTSAIYDRIRSGKESMIRGQRAAQRFTFSAENLPERTRQVCNKNFFYSKYIC